MDLIKRNTNLIILLVFQILLVLKVWTIEGWEFAEGALRLAITCASLALMVLLWNALLSRLPRRRLALVLNLVFVLSYMALQGYHWLRHEPLSFLILYKNGGDLLTPESIGFLFSNFTALGLVAAASVLLAVALLQWRHDAFGALQTVRYRGREIALLLVANAAVIATTPSVGNEYYEFASSAYRYILPSASTFDADALYPYLKTVPQEEQRAISDDPERPHVFVVMLESFSAYYMDRVENGQPVTPFLDELKHQGLFASDFYSASVETSKGQFATLCSVFPAYRSNVFTTYPNNEFRCLSHILKENGYTNVFLKAFDNLGFENTGNFVNANAFDHAHGMDKNFVTKAERKKYKFGWGIQDDIFYRKTFEYLDTLREEHGEDSRFFVTTMSVTNHMMFDDIPAEQRYIYPDASTHHENYTNSMHLTDRYLREFFKQLQARDWLKNSLIVVTGDNGFPMGQHDNYYNTKTGYNELYKMPLLILWGDKIEPTTLDDRAYSQLDIAPTLLDLLGINTTHHFVGQSLFDINDETHFVPLIQPFDGTWLSSIRHPYKYMQHQKTGKELLFDLTQDASEKNNLIEAASVDVELLDKLRLDVELIKYNEVLLEENRIFPSTSDDSFRVRVAEVDVEVGESVRLQLIGEANEEARITVTAERLNTASGRPESTSLVIPAREDLNVPGDILRPGINRLTFTIESDGTVLHTMEQDVFVRSEAAQLLSDMPLKGKQGWGSLGNNKSVGGRPLRVAKTEFDFGLGTHAPSTHSVVLAGEFTWFQTSFGLDDESRCGDGAVFEIRADGKTLYKSRATKQGKIKKALLRVSGYQELKLITHSLETRNCDHTNWLNPVLYR